MAKKKVSKTTQKKSVPASRSKATPAKKRNTPVTKPVNPEKKPSNFFNQVKLDESYTSLVLGIIVVVLVAFVGFSLLNLRKPGSQAKPDTSSQTTEQKNQAEIKATQPALSSQTYAVAPGEDLYVIAEKLYRSRDRWIDLAKANNMKTATELTAGMELKVPVIDISTMPDRIEGDSYTVKEGDDLWGIALRAYGDGNRFPDIVSANNLARPDNLPAGTSIKIPR